MPGGGWDSLPNGHWIACVGWVMYGMVLQIASVDSGAERCGGGDRPSWKAVQPDGYLANRKFRFVGIQEKPEPFPKFPRLIRQRGN